MAIINPWWFYLYGVVDNINFVLGLALVILGILLAAFTFFILDEGYEFFKIMKPYYILWLILGIVLIFTPSKNTLLQMAIAKQVTVEKVDQSKIVIEKVYKDILNIIKDKER